MPTARAARGTVRARLLDAALELLAEREAETLTLDAIRAAAGVSAGALYHHFRDRRALLGALYVEVLGRYQAAFLATLDEHDGARASVRAIVEHHLAWCAEDPVRTGLLLRQRELADPAALRERNRAFFGAVRRWLAPHVESGTLRDLPIELLAAIWIGPSQELTRTMLGAGRPSRQTIDTLADAAWHGLRQPT